MCISPVFHSLLSLRLPVFFHLLHCVHVNLAYVHHPSSMCWSIEVFSFPLYICLPLLPTIYLSVCLSLSLALSIFYLCTVYLYLSRARYLLSVYFLLCTVRTSTIVIQLVSHVPLSPPFSLRTPELALTHSSDFVHPS